MDKSFLASLCGPQVYLSPQFSMSPPLQKKKRHLARRRRKTSPTAMGRTTVFLFFKAVREALQKVGPTPLKKPLAEQKLISLASFCIAILDCSGLFRRMALDRCSGYIMFAPAAVPIVKEDNMSLTTFSEN